MAKLIDETGKIYGYLTVLGRAENKNNRAMWKCKCKCGKETIVSGKSLRNGETKSCGCLKKEVLIQRNIEKGGDLTGQRFGKLVVLNFFDWKVRNNGKRVRIWECQCDCGNICYVQHQYLNFGDTNSCGCSHSKGNATITRLLNEKQINYIAEYNDKRFISSKGGDYYYDFAILNENNELVCMIEYQGDIHFLAKGNGWNTEESLIKRQQRDLEKKELCDKYEIPLYYITYLEDIEKNLEEDLNECRN